MVHWVKDKMSYRGKNKPFKPDFMCTKCVDLNRGISYSGTSRHKFNWFKQAVLIFKII